MSSLSTLRAKTAIALPKCFDNFSNLQLKKAGELKASTEIKAHFPHLLNSLPLELVNSVDLIHQPLKVGVVFSGGPAAGGNNVVAGLFYGLKMLNNNSELIGFLDGPSGIVENKCRPLDENLIKSHFNLGGFDLIGTGRTKIETNEQFAAAAETVHQNQLDGLVIIGGDDSNTNAALLAEYFLANGIACSVIGVPKTIDGDLKNEEIEISFGFDTATKTYSEIIGNLLKDALSQKKYTFFIKIMGRSASHVALECALKTHPNLTIIGEELARNKTTLKELVKEIADLITLRAKAKKFYSVIIIPEGVIEFIPEFKQLIKELNNGSSLSQEANNCYNLLPDAIKKQLDLDRDPHGNIQVSKIETERLLIELVANELSKREIKFSPQPLFLGYEGRSCFPSNFDCCYAYALGFMASLLIDQKASGYMAAIQQLHRPIEEWQAKAIPLISMMHMEKRGTSVKPVIEKKLVDLDLEPFKSFAKKRVEWGKTDNYQFPGPIQFFGPNEITDTIPLTLQKNLQV